MYYHQVQKITWDGKWRVKILKKVHSISQLEEVMSKREELTAEVNTLTTIALKLQGAIEVLNGMEEESKQKR